MTKFPHLTIRQLFILLVLNREPNYIYSTWRELIAGNYELKICLSAVRSIFRTFEEKKLIKEMTVGVHKSSHGPRRRIFKITANGQIVAQYYYNSIKKLTNKFTERN